MKILKLISVSFCLLLALNISAHAAEPLEGVRHKFEKSDHHWQLESKGSSVISLFEGQSKSPSAQYDLERCMFCAGEDDNCESDGVVELNLISQPEEPILAVVCHVGAHSQRLQVLMPTRNQSKAVYTATGAYYITFEKTSDGITIQYDTTTDDGSFTQITESWP